MKALHELVADKLERDPALLRIPLENIDRWLANGHTAPHRLEQWRRIILRAQEPSRQKESPVPAGRNGIVHWLSRFGHRGVVLFQQPAEWRIHSYAEPIRQVDGDVGSDSLQGDEHCRKERGVLGPRPAWGAFCVV